MAELHVGHTRACSIHTAARCLASSFYVHLIPKLKCRPTSPPHLSRDPGLSRRVAFPAARPVTRSPLGPSHPRPTCAQINGEGSFIRPSLTPAAPEGPSQSHMCSPETARILRYCYFHTTATTRSHTAVLHLHVSPM